MDFFVNELSLHSQFQTVEEFFAAVKTVMKIRLEIQRAGRELYCHRDLAHARVTAELSMPAAIRAMVRDERHAWMQWLTRRGPFWPDRRLHDADEWLEVEDGTIVTDSGVGEAAFRSLHELPAGTITFEGSSWQRTPIIVTWRRADESLAVVDLPNHWQVATVANTLAKLRRPFDSWESLEHHLRRSCENVLFADGFLRMRRYPYVKSVAEGIWMLTSVLNKMSAAIDDDGKRTSAFNELYDTYFIGKAPYFTDESDSNKDEFQNDLTFPHPTKVGEHLFCSWHGKVNAPTNFPPVRIHFTWPVKAKGDLYVAYIGKNARCDDPAPERRSRVILKLRERGDGHWPFASQTIGWFGRRRPTTWRPHAPPSASKLDQPPDVHAANEPPHCFTRAPGVTRALKRSTGSLALQAMPRSNSMR
jgi:hypothetical protein